MPEYASIWIYDPSATWYGYHGQSASEYQSTFDSMSSQGFRAISVDAHVIDGSARYASIWIYDPSATWYGYHGQSASEYQSTFDSMSSQGFRAISVDAYVIDGAARYASIWIYDPSATWYGYHGQSASEYQGTFDSMSSQGFRVISVDAHVINGSARYASIWIYDPSATWYGYHGQSASEYQSTFDSMSSQGFRAISVDAHVIDGSARYASIWIYDPSATWYGYHGQSASVYQSTFDSMSSQGFRAINVDANEISYPGYRVCTEVGPYCGTGYGSCYWCFDGGNVVVIRHDNIPGVFATRYDHLKNGSIVVSPGERVTQGQKIAEVGSAGHSTGPHLHFEVWGTGFYELADPWAGPCGPNFDDSLWQYNSPWGF